MTAALFFSIGGIKGAIPLDDSMFLVRMVQPVSYPEEIHGVIGGLNLHGSIIPIYSLKLLLGLPGRSPRTTDHLIVMNAGGSEVALWVDTTYVVQDAGMSADTDASFQFPDNGISILHDGLVFIHDIHRFLTSCLSAEGDEIIRAVHQMNPVSDPEWEDGSAPPTPETLQMLHRRGWELASPEERPCEILSMEVLTFQLVYQEYAVEMKYVRESVLSREITPVPGTPDHVIGVLPVRGEIIPLIDLRVLLRIPETGLTDLNQVIILTDGVITFGILADQITGIISVPCDEISPPSPDMTQGKPEYVIGITTNSMSVINAAAILADSDMIVDDSGDDTVIKNEKIREKF